MFHGEELVLLFLLVLFEFIGLLGLYEVTDLVQDNVALLEVLDYLVAKGEDFTDLDVGFLELGLGQFGDFVQLLDDRFLV